MCRAPGAKAANTIFKVFSMTRLGIKPQSTGYQVDALNRYTKRRSFQTTNAALLDIAKELKTRNRIEEQRLLIAEQKSRQQNYFNVPELNYNN